MRLFIFLIYLMPSVAFGSDKTFEPIQPVDDFFRDAFVWEDRELAATLSDFGQYGLVLGAPVFVYHNSDEADRKTKTLNAVGAIASVGLITQATKHFTLRTRPRGKGTKSFFSGHTSAAFAGAGVMCQEEPKACLPSLLVASSVGYLRLAADRHWMSDVVVGAFVGFSGGAYLPTVFASF